MNSRDDAGATPATQLRHDRAFVAFWTARTISTSGTAVGAVALPILMYELTESVSLTALLAAVQFLPYVVLGPTVGALADRGHRKATMISSDVANGVLMATIPAASVLDILTSYQVLAVATLSGVAFVWFDAANFGAVPALVGRDVLVRAMSAMSASSIAADIVGPSLAGLLVSTAGPAWTIAADVASYLLSAAIIGGIRHPMDAPARARASPRTTLMQEVGEGFAYLWTHPVLRPLTIVSAGLSFTGGAVVGLGIVYVITTLHVPANDWRIGFFVTAGAVGGFVATILLPRLVRSLGVGRITSLGLAVNFISLVGMAVAPSYAIGVGANTLYEGSYSIVTLNAITARQRLTPDVLMSRVNTISRLLGIAGRPVGAAVGAALAAVLPLRVTLGIMAVGVIASWLLTQFSALREG